jgi:hypothetical protein
MEKTKIERISDYPNDLKEGLYELDEHLKAVRHYYL